jgi:uncharacterized protein (DUF2461 family)
MNCVRFEGFKAGLFNYLSALAENNNKEWFDEHRFDYRAQVLAPVKAFVAELGPMLSILNDEFETTPRIGRTISRINSDPRLHRNRPPYHPYLYVRFPRRKKRWTSGALLYAGIYSHGVSVGFYPGGYRELRTGPVQQSIRKSPRLFQRYLDEQRIAENYWELAGGESSAVTKWPLPATARRWVNLESFNVGEYFPATVPRLSRRSFLDTAQEVLLDLYPLWLFATSDNLKDDLESYREKAAALARPLTRVASR